MKLRLMLLLAAFSAISMTLVACGGDDDDDSGDDTSSSSSGDATTASGSGEVTGSGANDLKKYAKDLSGKTFMVTYDYVQGSGAEETKGAMTIGQKDGKSYMKLVEGNDETILIDDKTSSFLCSKSGGDEGCLKSKSTGGAGPFSLEDVLGDLDQDIKVTKQKDQRIAGKDGACFKVEEEGSANGTMCFDKKDGLLLLIDSEEDEDGVSLKATKVDTSVDNKVFEPPYKVTDTGN